MKFLLDTNVLSEAVNTKPNKSVLRNLRKHENDIATAAPVWHELQYGYRRLPPSRKRKVIESFLQDVVRQSMMILPYDAEAAVWHASERSRLTAQGKTPSFVDGQIAAIATVNSLILVTRNVEDFQIFQALRLENWHRR